MTILDEGSIARDGHEDWAEASGADKRFAGAPLTSPLKERAKGLEFGTQNASDALAYACCARAVLVLCSGYRRRKP